ncbi:MAG: aminotransferase class V-fold PLP-dependent enzyme, partial [Terriglobales bacterium]
PALRDKVFLDAACVSLAPAPAVAAIQKFLEMAALCPEPSSTLHHIAMDDLRAEARPVVARLLNAAEDEIALVESTTHGLSLAAQAIPLEPGDRVLLPDLEFMEVAVPWVQLQRERGIELDVVPHREGRILAEDVAARITPRTRVLAISSVQWSNGFRCDLGALGALCRDRKLWFVVDAIQQLGAVPIDLRKTPVDILACGGHKWLNAPFGCGFLYLRRDRRSLVRPPLAGYLSVEPPQGGWDNYFQTPSITPVRDYAFVSEARRFETGGTANYPGAIGLAASLKMILALGQERIAARVLELSGRLLDGLRTLGVTVVTPPAAAERAGILTFTLGPVERNLRLMERLLERKILVSVRYTSEVGGIRVSCHFFNSSADVDRLLNAVEELRPAL